MDHKGAPWSIEGHCGYLPGYVDNRAFPNFSENVVGFSLQFFGGKKRLFFVFILSGLPRTL